MCQTGNLKAPDWILPGLTKLGKSSQKNVFCPNLANLYIRMLPDQTLAIHLWRFVRYNFGKAIFFCGDLSGTTLVRQYSFVEICQVQLW